MVSSSILLFGKEPRKFFRNNIIKCGRFKGVEKEVEMGGKKRKIKIPEPEKDDFSGKLNVRMPKSLHRKLSYKSKQEGVSLNTLISTTLASQV